MAQIDEIKAKIKALRAETEANSITPDSLGYILEQLAGCIEESEILSQKGFPDGIASLDSKGKVPLAQIYTAAPWINIELKIEAGLLVLHPVEFFPEGTNTEGFHIRLMRRVSTKDRVERPAGGKPGSYRRMNGWRLPKRTNAEESKFIYYDWAYRPGETNTISHTAGEIGGPVVDDAFPHVIVHYGRYKKEFEFNEDTEVASREQLVIRQFGLAVFDGQKRISNIARFSIHVTSDSSKSGLVYSFAFEKGTLPKEAI